MFLMTQGKPFSMHQVVLNCFLLSVMLVVMLVSGCRCEATPGFDPTLRSPGQDHAAIATYYNRHAAALHQRAEQMTYRGMIYERLFGRDSDWVSGAQLLVQFYEDMAREQDRLADLHLNLSKDRSPNQPPGSQNR
jgi:hypothetical protein